MKLKDDMITYDTGDEQMMVSSGASGFNGLVRNNETAAFIVDCLKQETTEEAILARMLETYDAPGAVMAADLHRIILKLREIGALDE